MKTYIALLRGINVSGYNSIKMADLKELLLSIELKNVITYIQSGNIVFTSSEKNTKVLEELIYNAIEFKYGYKIKVLVLSKSYFSQVFNQLPLINLKDLDTKKLGVIFLKETPSKENIDKLHTLKTNEEHLIFMDKVCYIYCPNGFSKTKITNNTVETKLNTSATTRNWNTIRKLVDLSNQ